MTAVSANTFPVNIRSACAYTNTWPVVLQASTVPPSSLFPSFACAVGNQISTRVPQCPGGASATLGERILITPPFRSTRSRAIDSPLLCLCVSNWAGKGSLVLPGASCTSEVVGTNAWACACTYRAGVQHSVHGSGRVTGEVQGKSPRQPRSD
jgi:hypothetical protein